MQKHKMLLRVVANSALGVVLIFVWSRFVNLPQIWQILKTVNPSYLLIFFLIFFVTGSLRGLRFKLLLKNLPLTLKDSIRLTFVSQFLSFMIPLRVGELTKSVYVTTQFGTPLAKSITWVFIDRFLDFWVILATVILSLLFIPNQISPNLFKIMIIIFGLFSACGLIVLSSQSLAKKMVNFIARFLVIQTLRKKFISFFENIIDAFSVLKRPIDQFLLLILISMLAVCFDSLIWVIVYASLGKQIALPVSILGNGLMAFTFLIPAAPGYVGSAEASGLAVFAGVLKFNPNLASATSLLSHILILIALPIFGVISLYFLKFDLGVVWKTLKTGKKQ